MADTTPTLREAAQQALEALVDVDDMFAGHYRDEHLPQNETDVPIENVQAAITVLRAALAEQAAEQAGPAALDVTLTEEETSFLRDTVASEDGDPPPPIRLIVGHGHSGYGLYVSLAEYGDEGSSLLTALAAPPAPARQEPPADWSVFNTGAEVAGGLTYAEALDYLTPARLERGWSAVCVVNKDNITAAPPAPARQEPLTEAQAKPLDEWDESNSDVLWWRFPIDEPPYVGHPNCDDWPGYHTHWTPLIVPAAPAEGGA